ncbi:MAG: nucleotidyltransferase domain-containing protein [Candidatus Zixiibacteriota bacterium]
MVTVTDKLLKDVTNTIVNSANPVAVYLFGSYANGTPGPNSDLDLLVVVDGRFDQTRNRLAGINKIRRELAQYRIAKDVLLYSKDELDQWRDSKNHIIGRCLREGRVLYARS